MTKKKKTSNKGLVADHTYNFINDDTDHKKGWKFNGILLDKIKVFCLTNRIELDKQKLKNYRYGDYANQMLKILN